MDTALLFAFTGLGARQLGEFLQERAQRVGGGVVAGDYGVLPGWSRNRNAVIELVGDSGFTEQLLGQGSEISNSQYGTWGFLPG
jgi:hypothetical protein